LATRDGFSTIQTCGAAGLASDPIDSVSGVGAELGQGQADRLAERRPGPRGERERSVAGGPKARDQHRGRERVAFDAGALPQRAALRRGGRRRLAVEAGERTQHVGGKATAVVQRMRVAARLVGEGRQPPMMAGAASNPSTPAYATSASTSICSGP
jgi:hypothetical protein